MKAKSLFVLMFILGTAVPSRAEVAVGGVAVGDGVSVGGVSVGGTSIPDGNPGRRAGRGRDYYFSLEKGSVFSVEIFPEWRFVYTLEIKMANSPSPKSFQILVNGAPKTVSVRGDVYRVVIEETMNEVEFKGLSKVDLEIEDIEANCEEKSKETIALPPWPEKELELPARQKGAWLARRALEDVNALAPHVDPKTEYGRYLVPIREVAKRAYRVALREEDLSGETRKVLIAMASQIFAADCLLESVMGRSDEEESSRAADLYQVAVEIERRLKWTRP